MRAKGKTTTIANRDELESVFGELAAALIERDRMVAAMEKCICEIRQRYEARLADLEVSAASIVEDMESYCTLYGADLFSAGKRSCDLVHGTIGWRLGNPALRCRKGVKWDYVVEALKRAGLDRFVRVSEEVDKERVLAERREIPDDQLAQVGLRIEQAERFYAEPKREDPGA